MPKFLLKNPKTSEEQIFTLPQAKISLGRNPSCDIELADKSISRRHAEVQKLGEDFFLTDLKSGNGTHLNGKKIRPMEKQLLRETDIIQIENYEIQFLGEIEDTSGPVEENTDTDIIEVKMLKKVLKALDRENAASLEVLNGKNQNQKIYFTEDKEELLIGRDPKAELNIDDPGISRHHAKIKRTLSGIALIDLDSRNGTIVNGQKIKEVHLKDGDKLLFGSIKILFRNPKDVDINEISQELSRKKREAALREAELIELKRKEELDAIEAQKKLEEEQRALQLEEAAKKEKELEELENQTKQAVEAAAQKAPPPEISANLDQQPPSPQKPVITSKLSTTEIMLIILGVLVLLATVGAIAYLLI